MLSVCTGAFVLGQAGLLDGRACTTHWMHTDELAERFPRAEVRPGVLYVDEGTVVTSAGSAAGLDACLHLWREDHGAAVASAVARRMVVPPQRDGGQAQFIRSAVPACDEETLGGLLVLDARAPRRAADGHLPGPDRRRCRSGPSPAASGPRPAPPRTPG